MKSTLKLAKQTPAAPAFPCLRQNVDVGVVLFSGLDSGYDSADGTIVKEAAGSHMREHVLGYRSIWSFSAFKPLPPGSKVTLTA